MKVGLFINTQFQPGQSVAAHLPDLVAQTRAARDAGFKSLWFPHHFLTGPLQMLQIVPMMAYLAPHAEGMQIGPNILILPLLNPIQVAEESATLDVLTGGNYVLGVGLGYREVEFTAFNMSLKERAPRLEESIALIRRLWTEDNVTHKGRFYQVNDATLLPETGTRRWPANLDGRHRRTRHPTCRPHSRCLDDRPQHHVGRPRPTDANLSRGTGRPHSRLLPDGARMLRRRQPQDRIRGMPRRPAIQIRCVRLLGPVRPPELQPSRISPATASSSATPHS